ncbi:TonB-dependent siderophore receptor [Nostoc punctiforme]|uniref:TonB-dependent siderophore receptor n=1 Tax=Nostoc punctiforme (strain ATCC 29133 / PCC 73102) TaxID=63737 RepID=B2J112_NOSP7|nr:TonB-dependent siderophore receptor [Nostoc punctiforme]ACC81863.1 TonB-dependent siderophore receptor [Nostoc punctiforme PCC 73102]
MKLLRSLFISCFFIVVIIQPTQAKEVTEISRLQELNRSTRTVKEWLAQIEQQNPPDQKEKQESEVVQVTSVKANPTDKGLEVILQTSKGQELQVVNRSSGNNFITDIPNAQLRLPNGDAFTFRSTRPIAGVSEITVTNFDAQTIRVSVTGEAGVPIVELFDSPDEGIIFSVASSASSAQQPQQQPQTQNPTPSGQSEGSQQTQPTQPSAQNDEPIELVVTGEQDGYAVPEASTATKTDTPLRDIPQSIQVIPQQVIRDQGITRITDATRNVSGTTIASGYGNLIGDVRVRGFSSGFLRDGFASQPFFIDGGNIEQVEVLKGPASVLYGASEPGGIVNYVTKKPLSNPYYAVDLTAGSYDFYKSAIDLTGPLSNDKLLLYRLNVSYENSGSYRDFIDNDIVFIAPVVTYQVSDSTDITLAYEYLNAKLGFDRGFQPFSAFLQVPRNLNIAETDDFQDIEQHRLNLTLNHRFNQNLRLRSGFLYLSEKQDSFVTQPGELDADGRTLTDRSYFGGPSNADNYALQTDLIGDFKTGSITHQLLLGLEWRKRDQADRGISGVYEGSFDIFNPAYGLPRIADPNSFFEQTTITTGIYLQDQVTLLPNLKLLAGGRYDFVEYSSGDGQSAPTEFYDSAFSPRIGIVYQPIEPISLYASYSSSFVPNNSRTASGEPLEPSRGTQYEVGIKAELFDKRLSATLAVYDITKTNIPTTDPDDDQFLIAVGEVKSRGIELDIAGEISPGWKVIASGYLNDAFVSKDNNLPEGRRLTNAPTQGASLWTNYEIQKGDLRGLGIGAGLFFVGDRTANIDDPLTLPSYVRTDASISYKRDNWRAALNFKNIFNIKYYESNDYLVFPQAPFTLQGTISVEF